eukprot:scaffold4110_cov39-Phaeocystis_antarctica.AAC.2
MAITGSRAMAMAAASSSITASAGELTTPTGKTTLVLSQNLSPENWHPDARKIVRVALPRRSSDDNPIAPE